MFDRWGVLVVVVVVVVVFVVVVDGVVAVVAVGADVRMGYLLMLRRCAAVVF